MELSEVLAKVAKGTELSDDEKAFVSSYNPISQVEIQEKINQKIGREREKHEKQTAAMQEQLAELAEKLEVTGESGNEVEKLQKQLAKLTEKQAEAAKALEDERTARASVVRESALKGLDVPWMEDVPAQYRTMAVSDAFAEVDTEDLTDATVTSPILAGILSANERFIASDAKPGAGSAGAQSMRNGTPPKTDYTQQIDWKAIKRIEGQEGVTKRLNDMWAAPIE